MDKKKSILQTIANAAKENLLRDKRLVSVFFLFKNDYLIGGPQPIFFNKNYGKIPKDIAMVVIGKLAQIIQADKIILVVDIAIKDAPIGREYDITDAPSTYPKSMRKEGILITEILLDSSKQNHMIIPYKGGDGEAVEFLTEDPYTEADRYESALCDMILDSYNGKVS